MIKTICLVRHGRASQGDLGMSDKNRPLETLGVFETKELTKKLVYEGVKPDVIFSSTAVRAYQTALEMAQVLGFSPDKIQKENILYLGDEDTIMDVLMCLPDHINMVILVGHNPGITDFVNLFLDPPMGAMAPSTIVELQFKLKKWQQLAESRAKTSRIYPPDNLL